MSVSEKLHVQRISRQEGEIVRRKLTREVISEATLSVMVNGKEFISLLCLPVEPVELSLGFLFNEGWINGPEEVSDISESSDPLMVRVRINRWEGARPSIGQVTSTSAKGITFLNKRPPRRISVPRNAMKVDIETVWKLMAELHRRSVLHREIGGVHSALLLCDDAEIYREDIGRHNCLDRISGHLLQTGNISSASRGILVSSGRVSTEMLSKALRMRVPVYVSRTTPTSTAVRMARRYGVTLIGYVRGEDAVVYSGGERIN